MDYAAAAEALMRRKMLESICERMTDEEKRLFIQMKMQNRSHKEIMSSLKQQQAQLSRLQKTQQTFASDFASNIAGNAVWDGLLWIARKLIK